MIADIYEYYNAPSIYIKNIDGALSFYKKHNKEITNLDRTISNLYESSIEFLNKHTTYFKKDLVHHFNIFNNFKPCYHRYTKIPENGLLLVNIKYKNKSIEYNDDLFEYYNPVKIDINPDNLSYEYLNYIVKGNLSDNAFGFIVNNKKYIKDFDRVSNYIGIDFLFDDFISWLESKINKINIMSNAYVDVMLEIINLYILDRQQFIEGLNLKDKKYNLNLDNNINKDFINNTTSLEIMNYYPYTEEIFQILLSKCRSNFNSNKKYDKYIKYIHFLCNKK